MYVYIHKNTKRRFLTLYMKCLTLYTISYFMNELSWFTYDFIKTREMNKEINQTYFRCKRRSNDLFLKKGGGRTIPIDR